jgi:hypothetical protein
MNNIQLSWENVEVILDHDDDGELYDKLCQNSKPSDFYFDLLDDNGITIINLSPKLFFDKNECMFDQPMYLEHILPDDFGDEMENVWSSERSIDEVRKDLLERGFMEEPKLTNMSDDEDFDDEDFDDEDNEELDNE